MNNRNHFLMLAMLSSALQGCQTIAMPKNQPTWKTEVQQRSEKKALLFKPKVIRLTPHKLAQIHALITQQKPENVTIMLSATHTRLNSQRIAALSQYLKQLGVEHIVHRTNDANEHSNHNVIMLEVTHYIAIPPQCPGWKDSMGDNTPLEGESNFACTTEANLAKMIANPRDLVDSHTAPSETQKQIRALNEYFEGKQKQLKIEKVNDSTS